MFQISDKVVCVDDGPCSGENRHKGEPALLKRGTVYVVRGMETCRRSGSPVVYLVGIVRDVNPSSGLEFGYKCERFRKLSEVQAENAMKQIAEAAKHVSDEELYRLICQLERTKEQHT